MGGAPFKHDQRPQSWLDLGGASRHMRRLFGPLGRGDREDVLAVFFNPRRPHPSIVSQRLDGGELSISPEEREVLMAYRKPNEILPAARPAEFARSDDWRATKMSLM